MRYELTANQKKLFRHWEFYPNDPSYNLVFLYKITGELDQERLRNAIEIVGNSIDLFKVHFENKKNELFHFYSPERHFRVKIIEKDLSETEKQFRERVLEHANKRCKEPFNLATWPLFEFTIYSSNNAEWYLIVNAPHILSDGFSYYGLIDSINVCYHSYSNDNFFKAPFLGRSAATETPKDLEFFQRELSGLDSLEVKTIKQERNERGILEGKTHRIKIRKEVIEACLKKIPFSEGVFFLALHALLLKKLTDEDRIVIGVPVLNRNRSEKNIFGYFVNTLPLSLDFHSIDSLKTLLETLNRKILRLLRHQSFDLNHLTETPPQLNNFFTFYSQELNFHLKNCIFERIYLNRNAIFSEFTFTVEKRKEDYMFCIEAGDYFKSLEFKPIVQTFLNSILLNENPTVQNIPLVDDPLHFQRLNSYSSYSGTKSISDEFEKIAAQYPDRIALNDFQSQMSYSQLDQLSNQIARFLLQKAPDAKQIILSVPRNCHLIALILGILKAGKCYVPMDQFCPPERFHYILDHQKSALVVGDLETQKKYRLFFEHFLPIDQLLSEAQSLNKKTLQLSIPSNEPAYIIYTSGTTGNPKGVPISHANLLSLLKTAKEKFSFSCEDVWTLFHSHAFDFSVWEIFGSLLSGGTLLILESQISKNPHQFYSILSDYKVTVLNQTPTAFRELIRVDLIERKPLKIRTVIFGGEALCFQNLKEWVRMHPLSQTKLINMYGITETTIHVTYYEIKSEDLDNQQSVIGKPLSNLGIEILNCDHQFVPHGMRGEIAIYGDGLSSGYYNAPELTAKKFIVKEGRRYYLSGDLGEINEEGNLIFLGRKDRQVQIRGFRVELDEIEFHILKTDFIQQCAIDVIEFEQQSRIVAYLVGKNTNEPALREKLKAYLPFYMIPSLFLFVESIPITINGKVDFTSLRSKFPLPAIRTFDTTPTEKKLHSIVAELLKKGDFSLEDNFWDIGLNSIDLATIFYNVKTQFSFDGISMAHLFQYTTLKKLADYIDKSATNSTSNCFQTKLKEQTYAK